MLFFLSSTSVTHGSIASNTTMHVICGTDVELTCPIRSVKTSDEVVCSYN